jgi:hypothetical protein
MDAPHHDQVPQLCSLVAELRRKSDALTRVAVVQQNPAGVGEDENELRQIVRIQKTCIASSEPAPLLHR